MPRPVKADRPVTAEPVVEVYIYYYLYNYLVSNNKYYIYI